MTAATATTEPPADGVETPPPRSRMLRSAVLAVTIGVVVAAALLVPMPLLTTGPGTVSEVAPLIEVGGQTTPIDGAYGLVTVHVDQPSIVETLLAALDDDRTLRDRDEVIPPRLEQRTYLELQRQEFRRSFRVAAAVGLEAAGRDVAITTAPQVAGVQTGGPADGILQVGDVIRRFDGVPVRSTEDLIELVEQVSVGDRLVLDVERQGEVVEVVVVAGRVSGLGHPGMGISLHTMEEDIELPVDVALLDQQGIGGPSAGLMVALTVYDLVADEDLAAGRLVVGTGTVDGTGAVGRIGSIAEKTRTALRSDADVMLVPASQAAEARAVAQGRLDVVGVRTVDEALETLRG